MLDHHDLLTSRHQSMKKWESSLEANENIFRVLRPHTLSLDLTRSFVLLFVYDGEAYQIGLKTSYTEIIETAYFCIR